MPDPSKTLVPRNLPAAFGAGAIIGTLGGLIGLGGSEIASHWPVIVNLLAGSLAGAWFGAGWATRLKAETLYKVIAALLVLIAVTLVFGHDASSSGAILTGAAQVGAGVFAGFSIGVAASLIGVAGGELLIPTLVPLFGAGIKLAVSFSLALSLPTMLVGFARYSQDQSFGVLDRNRGFVLVMAAGSIRGAFSGGRLLASCRVQSYCPSLR